MAIIIMVLSGFLASLSNFWLHCTLKKNGSSQNYLLFQFAFSGIFATFVLKDFQMHPVDGALGFLSGLLLSAMMYCLSLALKLGPAALTFSMINSVSVFPGIVFASLLGKTFGHAYSYWHAIGAILILLGLFQGSFSDLKSNKKWPYYTLLASLLNICFLLLVQWRAMLFKSDLPYSFFIPVHLKAEEGLFFMPCLYLSSMLFQTIAPKRAANFQKTEIIFALFGGVLSSIGTFFYLQSTYFAQANENAVIFPTYCISLILTTNLWSFFLYREKIEWRSNLLSISGIIISQI